MVENKTSMHEAMEKALGKAQEELDRACYLQESGKNPGIRKMNSNKAEWLRWVVYLADLGLETEKLLASAEAEEAEQSTEPEHKCTDCSCATKDKLIEDLTAVNEQLRAQLKAMVATLEEEESLRKNLILDEKLKWAIKFLEQAHEHCWLEGTNLVCSLDWLDQEINSLLGDSK